MKKNGEFLSPTGLKYDVPLSTGVIISRHGVEVVAGPIPLDLMAKYRKEANDMQIEHDRQWKELKEYKP